MFNIGGGEFLVIAAIALIVLGPQRLPEAARQAGKVMGEIRRLSSGFQKELQGAMDDAEKTANAERAAEAAAKSAPFAAAPEPAAAVPAKAARPRRSAPLRADPVPKGGPPRTKGA